jgi:hypothetical protein
MLARERKQSKRHSFEARRNDRRKHGLGWEMLLLRCLDAVPRCGASAANSCGLCGRFVPTQNTGGRFGVKTQPAGGAGPSEGGPSSGAEAGKTTAAARHGQEQQEEEEDHSPYTPITWRGRYYYYKFGFRDVESAAPGVRKRSPPWNSASGRRCHLISSLLRGSDLDVVYTRC